MAPLNGWNAPRTWMAACAALCLLAFSPLTGLASDVEELEQSLAPGNEALAGVLPELDALAGPMSRDVLDGKADIHVFYGMALARILHEQCRDMVSLLRSADAQGCPAMEAALVKQLGDTAIRLEGAGELIAGSLPMTNNQRLGILGYATVEALRIYLVPLKEFAGRVKRKAL